MSNHEHLIVDQCKKMYRYDHDDDDFSDDYVNSVFDDDDGHFDDGHFDDDEFSYDDDVYSVFDDTDYRPEAMLQEHLTALGDSWSNRLDLDDYSIRHIVGMCEDGNGSASAKQEVILQLYSDVLRGIQNSNIGTIKGVVLGTRVLQLWTLAQRTAIYQALTVLHSASISHWQLGTKDVDDIVGMPAEQLLSTLISTAWPCLTAFEMRGVQLPNTESIQHLVQFAQSVSPTIENFNIHGIVVPPKVVTSGGHDGALLDPLLTALGSSLQLNDLQLGRMALEGNEMDDSHMSPLVSSQALLKLLQDKPALRRLTLDGMGLKDAHLQVLGSQLVASKDCRVHVLLSLRNNASVSSEALAQIYHICINKHHMGLVKSDDNNLMALVELVQPLNKLHRRLEYKDDQGNWTNADQWLAWLQVLSTLSIEDEARKLNYIWFTLLEDPVMIATAVQSCSAE